MLSRVLKRIEWASLLLLSISLLISFIAAELVMRRYMFGADAWSYEKMASIRHIGVSGLLRASSHLDILWELKPELNTLYDLQPLRTNSDGLRDRQYSKDKPPGVFRVAVIGDSFTMPEGVAIEDAYHTVLEDRFNSTIPGQRFEFINFGVPGYSLPQYVATIRHRALAFQPDLIMIGFCAANDSKKPNLEAFTKPYNVKPEENGYFHSYFFEHIGNIYKDFYEYVRDRHPGYNADAGYVNWQFDELAKVVSAAKLPVVIAYIDNKAASRDYEMVREASVSHGFYFIDGTTHFKEEIAPDHMIYLTNGHPNAAAQKVMADTLYGELRKFESGPLAIFSGRPSPTK